MCGIGGFSLSQNSRVNARQLAHELLTELEVRGSDASGYAYSKDGEFGIGKSAKPGSQLPLGDLPRNAKTVILHTRLATQGHPSVNANNHPVISPSGNIALVHNGVISNDFEYRDRWPDLPQVDSSVLPAIIEADGLKGLEDVSGYAAIAWLDSGHKSQNDVMNVARIDSSPVVYTWLLDGSFVWASTITILMSALNSCALEYGYIFSMSEGHMMSLKHGVPIDFQTDVKMSDDWSAWVKYGAATTGHRSASTRPMGIGSSFGNRATNESVWDDDASPASEDNLSWEDDYRVRSGGGNVVFDPDEVAMAYAPEHNGGVWVKDMETGELVKQDYTFDDQPTANTQMGFWVALIDGNIETFDTLEDMEAHLSWLSNLTLPDAAPFPTTPNMLRWTNQIVDMGDITTRDGMQSWVEDMARIDQYENPVVYNLDYVRDGIKDLITVQQADAS